MFRSLNLCKTAFNSPSTVLTRTMASKATRSYNFQDVKRLVEHPQKDTLLVDVREPKELQAYKMPTAVNIPLQSAPGALALPKNEFEDLFHFPKPQPSQELVFFCAKGLRAKAAEELARSYGYGKTGVYEGSINDWLANGGEKVKTE